MVKIKATLSKTLLATTIVAMAQVSTGAGSSPELARRWAFHLWLTPARVWPQAARFKIRPRCSVATEC
jgi:hypothetical protein